MEKQVRIVLLTTALLLAAMYGAAYQWRDPAPAKVQMTTACVQDIYNSVTVQGIVQAAENTAISPKQNAVVTAVYVKEGDVVQQGDILCSLSVREAFDQPPDLQSVWASLSEPDVQISIAEEKDAVRAPISGTVMAMPQMGAYVWTNIPCAQVADLNSLQVRARIPEIYADDLRNGQAANISAAAAKGKIYRAVVQSISPKAVRAISLTGERSEAIVEALLPLSKTATGLRPGYSVTAKIFTDFHPNAIVVPYEAVCQREDQEYIFCIENGYAVQRAVTTGYMLENVVEVTEGLKEGESVILSPDDSLASGTRVEAIV